MAASCDVRYQSAIVEVYASFMMADKPQSRYMVNRRAQFRVTDLVGSQLRVADSTIATLEGNIVEGLLPGRTSVQVRCINPSWVLYPVFIVGPSFQ